MKLYKNTLFRKNNQGKFPKWSFVMFGIYSAYKFKNDVFSFS